LAVVVESPTYDLTVFKVHFGHLTLKAYTKGERVLRIEATVHNTRDLGCGRVLQRFPEIVTRLRAMLERFLTTLDCVDVAFISDDVLDTLPRPSWLGKTRVGGIDLNQPRMRAVLSAVLTLGPAPTGFSAGQVRARVQALRRQPDRAYTPRQVAYDLKKLRAKGLIAKVGGSRRYQISPSGMRAITALLVLREQVIRPLLAGLRTHQRVPKPATSTTFDQHYERICRDLQSLFEDLGIAA
jgi:hypothetical protein